MWSPNKSCRSFYDELQLDDGYRLDLLVEDEIIVEIKAVEKILPVHVAQLLSYLQAHGQAAGPPSELQCPASRSRAAASRE